MACDKQVGGIQWDHPRPVRDAAALACFGIGEASHYVAVKAALTESYLRTAHTSTVVTVTKSSQEAGSSCKIVPALFA